MSNNSHFQRGHGVYDCIICERKTRGCADSVSLDMCEQCYELAGWDNHHNDEGELPTAEEMKQYREWRDIAVERGGNKERIEGLNDYIFNEDTEQL